jgi:rubrerythrin
MYPYNFSNVHHSSRNKKGVDKVNINTTPNENNFKARPKSPDDLILDMLRSAMIDEKEGSDYYLRLMSLATCVKDKEILKTISQNEFKHFKILEEIYTNLTGEKYDFCFEPRPIGANLAHEYEVCICAEISDFEFYRKLYFGFLNVQIRDMLYEIMTDEQNHAIKLSHLYSKLNLAKPMPY